MNQERRRYGFILERQTSLAKHNLAFYKKQQVLVEKYINSWVDVAKAREQIPESVENMFTTNLTVGNLITPVSFFIDSIILFCVVLNSK